MQDPHSISSGVRAEVVSWRRKSGTERIAVVVEAEAKKARPLTELDRTTKKWGRE